MDSLAEPHPELSPEEFFKHIDAELVEPRRMKQLLVWCAKRASTPPPPNKLGGDGNAHAIGMSSNYRTSLTTLLAFSLNIQAASTQALHEISMVARFTFSSCILLLCSNFIGAA